MVRKTRRVINSPLPVGSLPDGEVILAPVRLFRRVAIWGMTLSAAVSAAISSASSILTIVRSQRSVKVKWEQIEAEFLLSALQVMYSPKWLYRRGFRRGVCGCGPDLRYHRVGQTATG